MLATVKRHQLRETASPLITCLYFSQHICVLRFWNSLQTSFQILLSPKFYILGFSNIKLFNVLNSVPVWPHADHHLLCCLSRRSQCPHPRCQPHLNCGWLGSGTSQTTWVFSSQSPGNDSFDWHWDLERKSRNIYVLANRLKSLLIYLIKPYLITHSTSTHPCLTPHIVAKEISSAKGNGSKHMEIKSYQPKTEKKSI